MTYSISENCEQVVRGEVVRERSGKVAKGRGEGVGIDMVERFDKSNDKRS